jgi:hypothetical protein
MRAMRTRLGALALSVLFLAVISGGCKLSGVSAVYMAIDSMGAQERAVFYTDSAGIYCITKFSTAKQDSTVDFLIHQLHTGDPPTGPALHTLFANDEETPGPSTETVVAFNIPPGGTQVQVMCLGYCVQNGLGCEKGYTEQGMDSCGAGATCCFNPFTMASSPSTVLPYPVGEYECEVDVDGVEAGTTDFQIEYPPPDVSGYQCPAAAPLDGVVCAGWVPQGAHCPGFNSTECCVCDGAGWSCSSPPCQPQ